MIRPMDKRLLTIAGVVIIVILVGFFLIPRKPVVAPTTQPASSTKTVGENPPPQASDSANNEQLKEFNVTGSNYQFDPAVIKVKKGDLVKINFKSTGGFHDFVLDEFNVKTAVTGPGKVETVEFTPDRVGTFEYYCSVGNHRQMGMVGKLIVE